jgi:hyaluronoglucosaminidase
MKSFGVMEIFYGQPWSEVERLSYAKFLKELGMGFYIYGPKADECLRKNWRLTPTKEELAKYRGLRDEYNRQGLLFGIILSPHGLDGGFDLSARRALQEKIKILSDLGLDYLGLFFDDMKSAPNLAEKQIEIASVAVSSTQAKLIFCPSFYCYDPLLEMLFGDRPTGYLETLGQNLSQSVEILWTGEQIISPEITTEHLVAVRETLRRKPFVCDNFYADDGPMNCNVLRLVPPTGRSRDTFSKASGWAFNPMNQAHLSKLVLIAVMKYAAGGVEPKEAFAEAIRSSMPTPVADFIIAKAEVFANGGLESLPENERSTLRENLAAFATNPYAAEIIRWLNGDFTVDFMAMIEQSCYVG